MQTNATHTSRLGRWRPLVALTAISMASVCHGQLRLPDVFRNEPLLEVERQATARHRLTIVILTGGDPQTDPGISELLRNPTLRAWFLWHAEVKIVAVDENPEEYFPLAEYVAACGGSGPIMVLLPNGRNPKLITDPSRLNPFVAHRTPNPVDVLLHLDILMERLESIESVWYELHTLHNPPPEPPELLLYAEHDDGRGAPVTAVDVGPDPLRALRESRELRRAGYEYDATGMLTWLWENLESQDDALRAVRLLYVVDEMALLADDDEAAAQRFGALRDALSERLLWMDWTEWLAWMTSARAVAGEADVLITLDSLINDRWEDAMIPPAHGAAYRTLMDAMGRWTEPSRVIGDELQWLTREAGRLDQPAPPRTTAEDWSDVLSLRREVLVVEAARAHVALLKAGHEAEAFEVARLMLATLENDPAARTTAMRAMLWAGAAEGVIGAGHEAWIGEQAEVLRPMFRVEREQAQE